ncbi:MAG: hypothetical protein ACKOGG_02950, partial [Actinomycetota bacterium]
VLDGHQKEVEFKAQSGQTKSRQVATSELAQNPKGGQENRRQTLGEKAEHGSIAPWSAQRRAACKRAVGDSAVDNAAQARENFDDGTAIQFVGDRVD